jgi:hypothetical protein
MTALCPKPILVCGMRGTLLDSLGNVVDGPNNFYTTDNLIALTPTPDLFEPEERRQVSGCNCIIASAKFVPLLVRFNLAMQKGALEPALESLMIGSEVVLDPDSPADPIGAWWPNNSLCGSTQPPFVALEVWTEAFSGNRQSAQWAYVHWIWPMTRWNMTPGVLNTDFQEQALVGFSIPNTRWGHGPYGDDPGEEIGALGGYWFTNDPPPAGVCGFQTITPSS